LSIEFEECTPHAKEGLTSPLASTYRQHYRAEAVERRIIAAPETVVADVAHYLEQDPDEISNVPVRLPPGQRALQHLGPLFQQAVLQRTQLIRRHDRDVVDRDDAVLAEEVLGPSFADGGHRPGIGEVLHGRDEGRGDAGLLPQDATEVDRIPSETLKMAFIESAMVPMLWPSSSSLAIPQASAEPRQQPVIVLRANEIGKIGASSSLPRRSSKPLGGPRPAGVVVGPGQAKRSPSAGRQARNGEGAPRYLRVRPCPGLA
jgi:hypothetical protein